MAAQGEGSAGTARTRFPIIVLWTTPRSRSTAFERMMIERGDHQVVDEPFSARYYFSSERRSRRFGAQEPHAGVDNVLQDLLALAEQRPVFVKDMAYHLAGAVTPERLGCFTNTFLVREPVAAVSSLHRMWPDFTDEEAGYAALGEVFDHASGLHPVGRPPPVLDADDLATDPAGAVGAWCEAVGIDFRAEALTWAPGMVDEWARWRDWYTGAAASTGFDPPRRGAQGADVDPRVHEVAARARTTYEALAAHRLAAPDTRAPTAKDGSR